MGVNPPSGPSIDFDANATHALRPEVRERWIDLLREGIAEANPASAHRLGQRARARLEQARRRVANALGADPLAVVFTSGGTESNNLALLGAARKLRRDNRPCGVALSPLEHPCVLNSAAQLQSEGHAVAWIDIDARGRISPGSLFEVASRPEIGLVSIIWVQHELGNVMPLAEWVEKLRDLRGEAKGVNGAGNGDAEAARAKGRRASKRMGSQVPERPPLSDLWIHCDAVQAAGKMPIAFNDLDVDSLAISAHKFGGPKGVGALCVRRGLSLQALVSGGAQERGMRGGTPNPLLCDAMALALEISEQERDRENEGCRAIYRYLVDAIGALPGCRILGDPEQHCHTTLCLQVEDTVGDTLMMALDLEGFAVSTGAACSVGTSKASPTLLAMGMSQAQAKSIIRISWSAQRSLEDAKALAAALQRVLDRIKPKSFVRPKAEGVESPTLSNQEVYGE